MAAAVSAPRVVAVVVTFERPHLLRDALRAVCSQTRPPDGVIVVDNASADETPAVLRDEFPDIAVLRLASNEGGAGGFHAGLRGGHERGYDWLWLMDDDTLPAPDALEALLVAAERVGRGDRVPPILASRVVWDDGRLHPMNRVRPRVDDLDELVDAARRGLVAIRAATFVSLLVHRRAVDEHGLPHRHFFLWNDDVEYTARVLRDEPGYLVPDSVAHHRTPAPHTHLDAEPSRFYLAVRNGLWAARGPAFTPRERMLELLGLTYATGAYVRRRRFAPRALLAVLRGVRDGLRRPHRR